MTLPGGSLSLSVSFPPHGLSPKTPRLVSGAVAEVRAALETFGLVHEHKKGKQFTSHVRWQNLVKKAALRTVGGGAHHDGRDACRPRGGRQFWCCRVADPHHDRRGEVLSSPPSFPLAFFPTICPNVNHEPSLWAKRWQLGSGGGAIPMFPRLPRVLRARITEPLPRPAPLVGMSSSHVAISDVRSCVPGAPFVAVLRVLASPSATSKCHQVHRRRARRLRLACTIFR